MTLLIKNLKESAFSASTDSIGGATKATIKTVKSLNNSKNFKIDLFAFLKLSNNPNILSQNYIKYFYNKRAYKFGSLYNKSLKILGYQNYLSLNITLHLFINL